VFKGFSGSVQSSQKPPSVKISLRCAGKRPVKSKPAVATVARFSRVSWWRQNMPLPIALLRLSRKTDRPLGAGDLGGQSA
jgi:hypothetical protein